MNEKRSNEAKDKETTSGNRPENGPTMDDLEVRLTALAMGEASDFERSQLEAMMNDRPELQVLFEQFKQLHASLITMDVSATDEPLDKIADSDWKLSDERRSKLLAVINGEQPNPVQQLAVYLKSDAHTSRWNLRRLKWWGIGITTAASLLIGISWFQWRAFPMSVATSKSVRENFQAAAASSMDMAEPAVRSGLDFDQSALDETVRLEARYDQSQIMKQLAEATSTSPAPVVELYSDVTKNQWEFSIGEGQAIQNNSSGSSEQSLRQRVDEKSVGDRISVDSASGRIDNLFAIVDPDAKPAVGGSANPSPIPAEPQTSFLGAVGQKVESQLGEDVAAGQRYLWFDKKYAEQSPGGQPSVQDLAMSELQPTNSGALIGDFAAPSPQDAFGLEGRQNDDWRCGEF